MKNFFRSCRPGKGVSELLSFGSRTGSLQLTGPERDLFELMFIPQFYARQAGISELTSRHEIFSHFLAKGMKAGLSPSPLFEPAEYERQEERIGTNGTGLPAILRWCRARYSTGIVPTTRFDPVFYAAKYSEVVDAGADLFEHFIRHGLHEGRQPNGLFDPAFYGAIAPRGSGDSDLPPYAHYLTIGANAGAAPSAVLAPFMARTERDRSLGLEGYDAVTRAAARWIDALGADKTNLLISLCHPYLYDGEGALPKNATGVERLVHFLDHGIDQNLDPGPLFDAKYYASKVKSGGRAPEKLLLDFVGRDPRNRIIPTDLFDEVAYRTTWSDMRDPSIAVFEHFLTAGIFEGRGTRLGVERAVFKSPLRTTADYVRNWEIFWEEVGFPAVEYDIPETAIKKNHAPLWRDKDKLSDQDLAFLRKLFVPAWYAKQTGQDKFLSEADLFEHYLSTGIDANLSPSPLFDPKLAAQLCSADQSKSAMKLWLANRQPAWPAPTVFFDVNFYSRLYAELQDSQIDLYGHFIHHGLAEGRSPNPLFDSLWYDQAYTRPESEASLPAYVHFLTFGADRGLCPSRGLLPVYGMSRETEPPQLRDFAEIIEAFRPISSKLSPERCLAFLSFFVPPLYRAGDGCDDRARGIDRFLHFLRIGLEKGVSPGPMFDNDYYIQSYDDWKLFGLRRDPPFMHYLKNAWQKRLVPNTIFDEQRYQDLHPDVRMHNIWGFQHFLIHGVFEGRQVDSACTLAVSSRRGDLARFQLERWLLYWCRFADVSDMFDLAPTLTSQQRRLNTFLTSQIYLDSVSRAQNLEPAIGEPHKITEVYAAPHHDQLADVMSSLLERTSLGTYHTVITVPWLRTGGADLVACQLAAAIKTAFPRENVLIMRVDAPNFERPDWLPYGVDQVLVSDILTSIAPEFAEMALYALILNLQPKRVINVNSYRIWRTLERFANRLSERVNLYGYLFCWDQTPGGTRVGYPSMFYPATAPHMAGIFTDTEYLRRELLNIYRPPARVAERLITLYTPSRTVPDGTARSSLREKPSRRRPMILWAGRLDRQKRFDLVQEIAQRMPDVDFLCWGDPLLDNPPDLTKSPPNLTLHPAFTSYDEMPIAEADLWLFTSAWEGMPTILIELAIRGVPLVASQVGGVPELADEDTSFPVFGVGDPNEYVLAIRYALEHPELRMERSRKLQERAIVRHLEEAYVARLKEVFDVEV